MAKVEIYTKAFCPYCTRAMRLLAAKGVTPEEHDITMGGARRAEMMRRSGGRTTVPQVFVGGRHIGGSDDLAALDARALSIRCSRDDRSRPSDDRRNRPRGDGRTLVAAVDEAAEQGAAILFTPEMSGLLDRDRARAAAAIVREEDDTVLAAVRNAAAQRGVWVHLGSLAVRREDGRYANRGFVIDPDGAVRTRYDKLHLFDVALPTGERWRESDAYAPGEGAVVVDTPIGRLGLSICYDLRFPALYAALSEAGATVLAIPAAFTRPTGAAHWRVLMRARAIENAAFVVAAAQTGAHADGRETYGRSLVVDPWGEVLLDMGEAPGLALVEIDAARVAEIRTSVPVLAHRRAIPVVTLA